MLLDSALCEGEVSHRRFSPKVNQFTYQVSMIWLDLDDIVLLDNLPFWSAKHFQLIQFRRSDFISPQISNLKEAVYARLESERVNTKPGKIFLLANLRSWGYCFNPVSFYFCMDTEQRLYAIIAEITNTPWNERHAYVLAVNPQSMKEKAVEFNFVKAFHVSPYMPMDMHYQWRFRLADRRIFVHMKLFGDDSLVFDASMGLIKSPLTHATAIRAALVYPFRCSKVLAAIYWQAFKLWFKKVPFYEHPDENTSGSTQFEGPAPQRKSAANTVASGIRLKETSS